MNDYPNLIPSWLRWIDGRVILIGLLLLALFMMYEFATRADANTYNRLNECRACGSHISEAHDIDCPLDSDETENW